ncbi:DUF4214 domain-containing protein [Pseudoduganella sp.]|uniref:DUF4214 domain-containing protein n=1 Tax=Pseudoduganella sp. TaxID=1880898 RepID=UPI0035B1C428
MKQHIGTKQRPQQGTSGNDILQGTSDNDFLYGAGGNDEIYGGDGNDSVRAGMLWNGSAWVDDPLGDKLFGGNGDDYLEGGAGDDVLDGGAGHDELYGGAGNDHYIIRDRFDLVRDWRGSNTGTILADWVKPASNVSWTWGDGVQKLPYWIDALGFNALGYIGGALGGTPTVPYTFAQQPTAWFSAEDKNKFTPFNTAQQGVLKQVMGYISSVVNVQFVQVSDPETPYAIVFGNNEQTNSGGYASPIDSDHGSVLLLDYYRSYQDPGRDGGTALTQVLLHEIGHSLHLKHPFGHGDADGNVGDGPFLTDAEDMKSVSVMSYTRDAASTGFTSYSPFDLAALHYAYGVAPTARAGNDSYVLDPLAMNMLWDGNGIDTVDGAALAQDLVLDLRPGYWSHIGSKAGLITAAGQVTINFGTRLENALGGQGHDRLTGNEAANTLSGGAGNDVLAGREGDDTLDGGSGIDTAVYSGKRADYSITRGHGSASVGSAAEGKDVLAGVERLQFADTAVALDVDGINGQLFRLYQAAFDRKPDASGLGYWIAAADQGFSLGQIASAFIASPEFKQKYGANSDDSTFLTHLYTNVLHRQYDQDGFNYWMKTLQDGYSRELVLANFADSKENIDNVASLIANGFDYTPFV